MTNGEITRFFNTTRAYVQGKPDLHDPQVEGWFRTRQRFRNSSERAILQIPVGYGKTGLTALSPFFRYENIRNVNQCRKRKHNWINLPI